MYDTQASWQASSPKQPTAKSLSIGAASVPRDQCTFTGSSASSGATSAATCAATSAARLRLSLDLVARLSAALGAPPAARSQKRPPEQQSAPQTTALRLAEAASQHQPASRCRLRDCLHCCAGVEGSLSRRSSQATQQQPEAGSYQRQPTPAVEEVAHCAPRLQEVGGGSQTGDGFYCTTTTTTSLPGSLFPSKQEECSPLPLWAPTGADFQPTTTTPGKPHHRHHSTSLKLHCASRYISAEPPASRLEASAKEDELTMVAPLWGHHLASNSSLPAASSLRRLGCRPALSLPPEATTSTSLPGGPPAQPASRGPLKQLAHNLTNSQTHIPFTIQPHQQTQLDTAPGFAKTPVMRRPRRRRPIPKLASSVVAAAAICDTPPHDNHCRQAATSTWRLPPHSRVHHEPWWLLLTPFLLLLLTSTQSRAHATVLEASSNNSHYTTPPPPTSTLTTPQNDSANSGSSDYGAFSRFLEFARIFVMVAIIIGDICGNSLVILSVCRHTKLRVTTNWFVVSLACADILVALFAMTFNASVVISGRWLFGRWVCDFWNSCDVLASTASILHLCCISIDRYIAITRPLDYPMKITTRRVMYALCAVWISSALLSYLPIFTGVYTTSEHIEWLKANPDQCEFTVNRVYAIVSSSVSFWIPSSIMVFTYYRIYREASRQEKFIYKAQSMLPAPMPHSASNHHHHQHHHSSSGGTSNNSNSNKPRNKRHRSKSVAVGALANSRSQQQTGRQVGAGELGPNTGSSSMATTSLLTTTTTSLHSAGTGTGGDSGSILAISGAPATSSLDKLETSSGCTGNKPVPPTSLPHQQHQQLQQLAEEQDSNSGHSTPTKRSISKMKREHKAAKTLGIIMGVFILCWLPFFSWYTPMHICGSACHHIVPPEVVPILFWIGYFNSTLNPIIYAYFNHDFRDAFKKTLQWIFCCCNDLKCLRVNRPNDNQHYNCTYRSTQEIGLVSNS